MPPSFEAPGSSDAWRLAVCLDGSPHSEKAFARALTVCRASPNALLHLLTVIEPRNLVEQTGAYKSVATKSELLHAEASLLYEAQQLLAPFEERCSQAHVKCVPLVVEAMNAKEEICHQVEKHHINLLLVGTRGRSTISKLLMGSVAEYCTRHAKSDVMVVR